MDRYSKIRYRPFRQCLRYLRQKTSFFLSSRSFAFIFSHKLKMMRLFIIAVLIPFVTPLATTRHLEDGITAPAFGIRNTFSSTPPRLHSRAVLNILKRQNLCGTGSCGVRDTCCRSRGCCPGGASCCSNGSCCQVSPTTDSAVRFWSMFLLYKKNQY